MSRHLERPDEPDHHCVNCEIVMLDDGLVCFCCVGEMMALFGIYPGRTAMAHAVGILERKALVLQEAIAAAGRLWKDAVPTTVEKGVAS